MTVEQLQDIADVTAEALDAPYPHVVYNPKAKNNWARWPSCRVTLTTSTLRHSAPVQLMVIAHEVAHLSLWKEKAGKPRTIVVKRKPLTWVDESSDYYTGTHKGIFQARETEALKFWGLRPENYKRGYRRRLVDDITNEVLWGK